MQQRPTVASVCSQPEAKLETGKQAFLRILALILKLRGNPHLKNSSALPGSFKELKHN